MTALTTKLARLKQRFPRWRPFALGAIALLLGFILWRSRGTQAEAEATFVARRGPLDITVLEGGSIQALESQEIKCEVRVGYQGIKIIKIVEEGYLVTEDDIRTNKVLVELDSSDLEKQIVQQDIQYEQAVATLTETEQAYEIQLYQNLSDIKAAEQKARFARMDFEKFLGDAVAATIIDQLGLEEELAAQETNAAAMSSAVTAAAGASSARPGPGAANLPPDLAPAQPGGDQPPAVVLATPPITPPTNSVPVTVSPTLPPLQDSTRTIDFSQYAKIDVLGDGEAKQKLRKLEDDLQVAQKEMGQAKSTLDGTRRLFEKGFVTKIDLERDEIAFENSRLKVQTAQTARDLFLKYEFTKSAEEALSKYEEAVRELIRARKAAVSKLAQAEAKLKSAQSQFNIQTRARKELYEQLEKCTITAQKPGLVVYGGGRNNRFFGGEEQIREGATVRERQAIITIPDLTRMSVDVKIHESYIKKIKKGQAARITLDAFPDKVLEGEVAKVGVLPDSQNRWMNPDMKVYLTRINIKGTHDWLKPGMSAKVEIIVAQLADVVYVPIQAVSPFEGKRVCYIVNGRHAERRRVETGQFNDAFIEIKSGLAEGERVLLRPAARPEPEVPTEENRQPPAANPPVQPAATPVATGHKA